MKSRELFDSPNHTQLTPLDSSNADRVTPHNSSNPSQINSHSSERVILLKRPVFWSYIFASLLVGAGISVGIWAAIARFDQTIPATGTLELQGAVTDVKAPTQGVVQDIYVKDGEAVEENEPLVTFQSTVPPAELEALKKEKDTLIKENQLYEEVLKGETPSGESKLASLIQLRTELVKENQYYQTLVSDKTLKGKADSEFNANQQKLLAASSPEVQSRAAEMQLQIQTLEKQLSQVQEKLAATQKLLAVNQDILETQRTQQGTASQEYQRQKQEVSNNLAEIERLKAEQQRLTGEITKGKEELQNAIALSTKEVLTKISENQKRIAQIDSQLKQAQLDNQQRIAALDAQLTKAEQPQGQQMISPVEGVVFDLQPSEPGYVADANQTLMTIVPNDSLVASVFLNDKDIGLVKEGMDVEVRMASFPKSKFGSIPGKVVWVGSDVLPPTPQRPYYAFPARIQLNRPSLEMNGQPVRLQLGMSVNGEIILPDKLTVWDIARNKFEQRFRGAVEFAR
ncbi:MAG: HlyD family efflux transporter periplasmic adaptor subunit [Coleofasciculus sp. S288]|nr:HlyD family efflux transporter periplasmic adaptor subunit [Coleofasciculus sp. S288]